jgi:hypothetical protein
LEVVVVGVVVVMQTLHTHQAQHFQVAGQIQIEEQQGTVDCHQVVLV